MPTIVFMNKVDLVDDAEMSDLVEPEVRDAHGYGFSTATPPPVAREPRLPAYRDSVGRRGQRADRLLVAGDAYVPQLPQREIDRPFLMAVENVFSIAGTVASGRVEPRAAAAGRRGGTRPRR